MISDSSSLILFTSINRLDILFRLFNQIFISQEVYNEIIEKGKLDEKRDAYVLEDSIKTSKIKIEKLNQKYGKMTVSIKNVFSGLHAGESTSICLCLQKKEKFILMDDAKGRDAAKFYRITPIGTLGILLKAFKAGVINEKETMNLQRNIVSNGLRVSPEVIDTFRELFESLKK